MYLPELCRLYPNPANDFIAIQLNENLQVDYITLTDILGCQRIERFIPLGKTIIIDIRELPVGLYHVGLFGKNIKPALKFVKQ